MATKKMTKVEMFAEIKKVLTNPEQIAFIDHEIELVTKKNASKSTSMTPRQKENEEIAKAIESALVCGERYSVAQIMKTVPLIAEMGVEECSSHRTTAIVSAMVKSGRLVRSEEKGKAYFRKP